MLVRGLLSAATGDQAKHREEGEGDRDAGLVDASCFPRSEPATMQ